ncbi:MAG: hypothetical protein COT17_02780 [Elusimicrobia bacterium CG08_land_8_20_14_0_20_51_18]|nr:MAG: hypothetical protein COT17_02780 [Elusimicrobia bacterium CG08_land_8_20_14_0_20_51_18]
MKIRNKTSGLFVSENAVMAESFFSRLFGLIPRKSLKEGECLVLTRCAMIHTCFMRFPIDAVFISGDLRVVGVLEKMSPWKFSRYYKGAFYTAEFAAGFAKNRFEEGDEVEFSD